MAEMIHGRGPVGSLLLLIAVIALIFFAPSIRQWMGRPHHQGSVASSHHSRNMPPSPRVHWYRP